MPIKLFWIKSALRRPLFLCLLTTLQSFVYAAAYDECVLKEMKGVSGETAARMISQACKNKVNEARQKTITANFGSELDLRETRISLSEKFSVGSDGYKSLVVTNDTKNITVTYFQLIIKDMDYFDFPSPSPNQSRRGSKPSIWDNFNPTETDETTWQNDRTHYFYYKTTLGPGQSTKLKFKYPREGFYSSLGRTMGRESKGADRIGNFRTEILPEEKDPLK